MSSNTTLRFIAEPSGIPRAGRIAGGDILRWIDAAGCACATGWARRPCALVFTGSVRMERPVRAGEMVEVDARLAYTGGTNMNVLVEVRCSDLLTGDLGRVLECVAVFVSLDEHGQSLAVEPMSPSTPGEAVLAERVKAYLEAERGLIAAPAPSTAA